MPHQLICGNNAWSSVNCFFHPTPHFRAPTFSTNQYSANPGSDLSSTEGSRQESNHQPPSWTHHPSVVPIPATTLRCHFSVSSAQCLASHRDLERGGFLVGHGTGQRQTRLCSPLETAERDTVFRASQAGILSKLSHRNKETSTSWRYAKGQAGLSDLMQHPSTLCHKGTLANYSGQFLEEALSGR